MKDELLQKDALGGVNRIRAERTEDESKKSAATFGRDVCMYVVQLCEEDKAQLTRIESMLFGNLKLSLAALSADERLALIGDYCPRCGGVRPCVDPHLN